LNNYLLYLIDNIYKLHKEPKTKLNLELRSQCVWKFSPKQNAVAFGKNSGIMQLRKKKKKSKTRHAGPKFLRAFISQLQAVEELKLASTAGRQRYTEVSTGR